MRSPDLTAVLRPVREGNAFEETVERLLTVVKLGLVGPGERLPAERELAGQLGISRLTLREAIGELQQAGFVESRRGRFGGTFITYTPPAPGKGELRRIALEDGARLADALTFRLVVETGAAEVLARLCAQPADSPEAKAQANAKNPPDATGQGSSENPPDAENPPDIESLRATMLTRLAGVNDASPQDYRRLDTLFHLSIAELSGSSLLAAAATDARMRLNDLLNAIPVLRRNIAHTAGQHAAIVDAIL
ncbi:MAG: GntR family transcriptional regulator, partial [Streptosporangiaceae bacterium]